MSLDVTVLLQTVLPLDVFVLQQFVLPLTVCVLQQPVLSLGLDVSFILLSVPPLDVLLQPDVASGRVCSSADSAAPGGVCSTTDCDAPGRVCSTAVCTAPGYVCSTTNCSALDVNVLQQTVLLWTYQFYSSAPDRVSSAAACAVPISDQNLLDKFRLGFDHAVGKRIASSGCGPMQLYGAPTNPFSYSFLPLCGRYSVDACL
jgi:hypothetical protein